jgi:2-oxoglutarate ferredoxin oxidoreductase subunit alpha
VLLLSDQALATRKTTLCPPDLSRVQVVDRVKPGPEERAVGYQRYADTETGVSPMSAPGMPHAAYVSTGIEHDESGDPGYTPELARQMKEKRFRKFATLLRERGSELTRLWGDEGELEVGIIAFGSTEGVIREATERAQAAGHRVGHLHAAARSWCPS